MAKVTIEDISRRTGLSRGTVSRALNDRPDISKQTKQRVLECCRKLHYAPSHAARSLATGRSLAVAVLLDDLQTVFAASFLRGVLRRAQAAHYAVFATELGTQPEQQRTTIQGLVNERIDSVLVGMPTNEIISATLRETLEDRPVIACAPLEGIDCDLLIPDQAESGRLVARHLLENGTDSLLYVHRSDSTAATERLAGFLEICRERGLDPDSITLKLPAEHHLARESREMIKQHLERVTAAAATDDFSAVELLTLCLESGRIPGQDVAIMGQGNERVGDRITPSLTTTDFCAEEIGRRAMETALARLGKTRMDAPQCAYVPPVLITRQSTKLPNITF